jgi:hypothetical protein
MALPHEPIAFRWDSSPAFDWCMTKPRDCIKGECRAITRHPPEALHVTLGNGSICTVRPLSPESKALRLARAA